MLKFLMIASLCIEYRRRRPTCGRACNSNQPPSVITQASCSTLYNSSFPHIYQPLIVSFENGKMVSHTQAYQRAQNLRAVYHLLNLNDAFGYHVSINTLFLYVWLHVSGCDPLLYLATGLGHRIIRGLHVLRPHRLHG